MAEKTEVKTAVEKAEAGEKLTPAEEKEIMSAPNRGTGDDAPSPDKDKADEGKPAEDESTGIKKPGTKKSEDGETDEPDEKESDEETDGETSDEKDGETGDAEGEESEISPDTRTKIQKELEKPEGAEDLSDFSNRERGVFWELRKERLKRQRAEQETDELKFENLKKELKKDLGVKDEAADAGDESDPFADRDEDDLLTVADVKKLLARQRKPEAKKTTTPGKPLLSPEEVRVHKVEADSILTRKGIKDFYDVMDHAETVLGTDADAAAYLREVKHKGNNVALAAYHLIKASPKWTEIEASIAKKKSATVPDSNKKRAEKIEENTKKIRTTGGGGNPPAPADEYTVEELASMSPRDFGRLPKKTRDAILNKFGSNPNV